MTSDPEAELRVPLHYDFGGTQRRDTMLGVLERFARKAREGALAAQRGPGS